jgi:hypothetical protein
MPQTLSLHEITDLLEIDDSIQASAVVIQPPENAKPLFLMRTQKMKKVEQ